MRLAIRNVVLGAAAAAGLCGCVTRAPLTDAYEAPESLPAPLAERYTYAPATLEPRTDDVRQRRDFAVRDIVLPAQSSRGDGLELGGLAARGADLELGGLAADDHRLGKLAALGGDHGLGELAALDDERKLGDLAAGGDDFELGELVFEYYDVDTDDVTPAIIVLPIANGNMLVSRYFARYFASRGWAALVIDHARDPMEELLDDPERLIRQNIIEYRRILDWVEGQPELGAVGIFGISFGGMAAVMLAALDERVDAVVAAMAGGDLPYMMVNTSYRAVARQVHRTLRETGLSRERLKARLEEKIATDPLDLAPYVDAQDVLLVMTRTDMIVPFEAQERLRSELGEPETLYLPTGHRTSVFYFPLLRNSAFDFFERQFSASR